jgi:hypothetical protein
MEIKANALIIIDPQNDFVKGSLAVPGAEEAMNNIIKFIEDHKQDLGYIAVTLDWHPLSHCSFKEFGGSWPPHCVQYSEGVPNMEIAESKCFDADILVVIGTSFNVYPAASLVGYTDEDIPVYYIDPNPACTPDYPDIKVIKATATRGMEELIKILNDN